MASVSFTIENYTISYSRPALTSSHHIPYVLYGQINLVGSDPALHRCTVIVCTAPPGGELPQNKVTSANHSFIYIHPEQMAGVVDMLRNEKPVRVVGLNTNPNNIVIKTLSEEVGEGEE